MTVTESDIRNGVGDLNIADRPLCVHSALRSFGHVEGGPQTVIDGLLAEGCTVVVPAFNYNVEIPPPDDVRIERNGMDDREYPDPATAPRIYSPDVNSVSPDMGAVPRALLKMEGRARGSHPIDSFAAVGPLADEIIAGQTPRDVYRPLYNLAERDGLVLLIGVGLNRMTLLHTAEQVAGRNLFRRWALGPDGRPLMTEVGGCSEGFPNLEPALADLARETTVGKSRWRAFPAADVLEAAAEAIRQNPAVTHCGDPACARCRDAVQGGPVKAG